ncbi:hypothetical protein JZ751_021808, partial [Albula glossodonta]
LRSKWPGGDSLPAYVPLFSDGWRPPPPAVATPENGPVSRSNSQRFPPESHPPIPPEQNSGPWSPPPARPSAAPPIMRVMYDFMARNHQELSVMKGEEVQQDLRGPPMLNKMSRPDEVKAWLEYKGFSKMTIRTLGVLNGGLILGMTRDELRTVCPEEGARVFFQLQAVKSALALASESDHAQYNGR